MCTAFAGQVSHLLSLPCLDCPKCLTWLPQVRSTSVLDELASPHAPLPGGPAAPRAPPPMAAWDFARMGMPPAALQQLLGPAAGLMAQQVGLCTLPFCHNSECMLSSLEYTYRES